MSYKTKTEKRTDAYRFTVDSRQDPDLISLRKEISESNKTSDKKQRVSLRARYGKVRPAELRTRSFAGPQYVPLDLGERWDVYVHDVYKRRPASETWYPAPRPVPTVRDFWNDFETRLDQLVNSTLSTYNMMAFYTVSEDEASKVVNTVLMNKWKNM